jgi:hypothetical protein
MPEQTRNLLACKSWWANDVNRDERDVVRIIAAADGIVSQVEAENGHIESRKRDLTNLLVEGLEHIHRTPPDWGYLKAIEDDANGVAAYAASNLSIWRESTSKGH